jgi:hypothetical protein
MKVYLLTTGSGADGDEWGLISVHASKQSAMNAEQFYERDRYRDNGTIYNHEAEIEEWEVS